MDSLRLAKLNGYGVLPTYSRTLSDPVPGGVELMKTHKIVLVEGNYLLNWDDPKWANLRPLFEESWFIECEDMAAQRERLIDRHLLTWTPEKTAMWGHGEEGAAKRADTNDVLNAEFVDGHKKFANIIITSY